MALSLPGYSICRLLKATASTRVFEARRERDGQLVIAKVFALGGAGVEARVEHEFRTVHGLNIDGVVRALGLERIGDQLVLLLEHVPSINLAQRLLAGPLAIAEFLRIAVEITTILAQIHDARIVHRDLKPSNVLIEPESGKITIADFGISVVLESERAHLYDPDVLEGTLPYISPEQTGRTKRQVDARSDLYSLGVCLYELATGRRPFVSDSPLELVHAHLARRPPPPNRTRLDLPGPVSALIMRLLKKAPERRYQSARGLLYDLEHIQLELAEGALDQRLSSAAAIVRRTCACPTSSTGATPSSTSSSGSSTL